MTSFAIETHNLTKVYSPSRNPFQLKRQQLPSVPIKALSGIHLKITPGTTCALLGRNGAGKTTLIKMLATLVLPNKGHAAIHGYDVVKEAKQVKSLISLVIGEERSFYWRLTARENLEFFATLYGLSKPAMNKRILEACQMYDITYLNQRYQELSTGMKNRLALARSYLHDARVLFMDEPTRSLDPTAARMLREVIKDQLKTDNSKTLFFSTHNIQEAEELADQIAILKEGQLAAFGSLTTLREQIENPIASLEEIFNHFTDPARVNEVFA